MKPIACRLWDQLWKDYSRRVEYARTYHTMITAAGGTVANDHLAFRSLRLTINRSDGAVNLGIAYLASIAEELGYQVAGEYEFPERHLYARHYRHPQQNFNLPKLFISELIVDALPDPLAQQIEQTVSSVELAIDNASVAVEERVAQLQAAFTRPWQPPLRSVVEAANAVSQYAAWVLLHGYAVNHFTGYVNQQNTPRYPDIESTARGLAQQGVPMKAQIEGSRRSGLRQTATQAVTEMVTVQDDTSGKLIEIPWTYAYYEIAERHPIEITPGRRELFEGFLSSQAQNLFEMTRKIRN